jgi:hypothetical protein
MDQNICNPMARFRKQYYEYWCYIRASSILIGGTLLVAQLVEALRYKSESSGFCSGWRHFNFSLASFRLHYGPGYDSASNRNEYQEYFLVGGKGGVNSTGA